VIGPPCFDANVYMIVERKKLVIKLKELNYQEGELAGIKNRDLWKLKADFSFALGSRASNGVNRWYVFPL